MKIAKIRNEMSLCLVDISQKQKQFENSLKKSEITLSEIPWRNEKITAVK